MEINLLRGEVIPSNQINPQVSNVNYEIMYFSYLFQPPPEIAFLFALSGYPMCVCK